MPDNQALEQTVKRKLFQAGDSIVVAIPREWLNMHGLKGGDSVVLILDHFVRIVPFESKPETDK